MHMLFSLPILVSCALAGPTYPLRVATLLKSPPQNLQCSAVPFRQFARDLNSLGLPPLSLTLPFPSVRHLCAVAPLPCLGQRGVQSLATDLPPYDSLIAEARGETTLLEQLVSSSVTSLPTLPNLIALIHRFELVTPDDVRESLAAPSLPRGAHTLDQTSKDFLFRLQKYCLAATQLFISQPAQQKTLLLRLAKSCFANPYNIGGSSSIAQIDQRLLAYCTKKCLCLESQEDQSDRLSELKALQDELSSVSGKALLDHPSVLNGGEDGNDKGDSPVNGDVRYREHSQCTPSSLSSADSCRSKDWSQSKICGAICSGPASIFCDTTRGGCKCVHVTPSIQRAMSMDGLVGAAVCMFTARLPSGAWGLPGRGSGLAVGGVGGRSLGPSLEAECMCNATFHSTACCESSTGFIWDA